MLVDTHCHLDEKAFESDLAEVLTRAKSAGVRRIFTIGVTAATSEAAVRIAEQHAEVFAVVGVQPNYVASEPGDARERVRDLARHPRVVAIGETGLDRYWDHAPLPVQRDWFDWHLRLADEVELPFIVHCRDAEAEVVEQLTAYAAGRPLRGVMHSFCGTEETATACLKLGLHLSFSGMLTYKKNVELRAIAAAVPADRVLVETDAPYLAPVPHRGKRNEPAYVAATAELLAECRVVNLAELSEQTERNVAELFRLPVQAIKEAVTHPGG